ILFITSRFTVFPYTTLFRSKMVNKLEVFNVFRGELAIAFGVLFRLQYVKFLLPKADKGSVDLEGTGHFSNTVIAFFRKLYIHSTETSYIINRSVFGALRSPEVPAVNRGTGFPGKQHAAILHILQGLNFRNRN